MKKIILSLSIMFVLFMSNMSNVNAIDDAYYYKEYNVEIKINEDNTIEVTETMSAYFLEQRHGIIRSIPTKWDLIRADGSTTRVKPILKDIKCSTTCVEEVDGDYTKIKLGDENKYVYGDVLYGIKYTYDLGSDKLDNADEFYYNIIGSDYDTKIDKLNFQISFPKDFDTSQIGFSTGDVGNIGYNPDYLNYTVESNTIRGSYSTTIEPYNAFTIRVELYDGYFKGVDPSIDYIWYIVPILGLIILFAVWLKNGREKKSVITLEFEPPQGYNPLDVAYVYNGKLRLNHLLSLIIYLAEKGYIKISEKTSSKSNDNSNFTLYKVKEYDGDNQYEQSFMDILFDGKESVTKSHIEANCGIKLGNLCKSFEKDKREFMFKPGNTKRVAFGIFIIIATCLNFYVAVKDYSTISPMIYLFPLLGISVFVFSIDKSKNKSEIIFLSVWSLMFGLVPTIMIVFSFIDYINIVGAIAALSFVTIIIEILLLKFMSKRTEEANEIYGQILGLRKFIKTAELSRLQLLVDEDPTYFYKILPYAFVLSLNKKWINKFTDIHLDSPGFYNGHDNFYNRCNAFDRYIGSTSSAMNSSNSHSSSGYSGGGSSGGGGGGGGSSSW